MEVRHTKLYDVQAKLSESKKLDNYHNARGIYLDTCSFTGGVNQLPQTARGVLIELTDKLLQGFKSKTIKSIHEIAPENLVLVHMTNYLPTNGKIKTVREAAKDAQDVSPYRDTVHFALNHAVYEHQFGNWNDMKFAVLAPLDGMMNSNQKGNIIGGEIIDFFIKKSVKLPEGSVIIRHCSNVPEGKLRVLNAEDINEFKNTKGITVIETSGSVMETANKTVEMMGYSRVDKILQKMAALPDELINKKQEDLFNDPDLFEKFVNIDQSAFLKAKEETADAWNSFVKANGFKYYQHMTSPYGRSEALIESLNLICFKENSWEQEIGDGLYTAMLNIQKINYKEEFLQVIKEIKWSLGKDETLTFDIDKLEEIIKKSVTPKDALNQIALKLKLKPMKSEEECSDIAKVSSSIIFKLIDERIGLSPILKMAFNGNNSVQEIREALTQLVKFD